MTEQKQLLNYHPSVDLKKGAAHKYDRPLLSRTVDVLTYDRRLKEQP